MCLILLALDQNFDRRSKNAVVLLFAPTVFYSVLRLVGINMESAY